MRSPGLRLSKEFLAEDLQLLVFVLFVEFDEVRKSFVLAAASGEILGDVGFELVFENSETVCTGGLRQVGEFHIDDDRSRVAQSLNERLVECLPCRKQRGPLRLECDQAETGAFETVCIERLGVVLFFTLIGVACGRVVSVGAGNLAKDAPLGRRCPENARWE